MTRFSLERNPRRQLVLTDSDGTRHVDVEAIRAFPLTDPRHHISILDEKGREVLFIESIDEVPEPERAALEDALSQREFVPEIRKVLNTPEHTEPSTWQVETDRGVTTFELESEDSVHRRDGRRVSIVDTHGIRYEIPDVNRLDHHGRKVLERFL